MSPETVRVFASSLEEQVVRSLAPRYGFDEEEARKYLRNLIDINIIERSHTKMADMTKEIVSLNDEQTNINNATSEATSQRIRGTGAGRANNDHISKRKFFIDSYLNPDGTSQLIKRYALPEPIAFTSGDGIFRSDGRLGTEYKFFRFSKTLDLKKLSNCWEGNITSEEEDMIKEIHSSLEWDRSGKTTEWIQFFGRFSESAPSYPELREDLKSNMTAPGRYCANCGSTKDLQCDHKNDLYNDPRMFNKSEQTEDDVQTLCRKCNMRKKVSGQKRDNTNKRQPPPPHRYVEGLFGVKFTEGSDYLDRDDPNWYKGTYWGDCLEYNKKTTISM